MSQLTKYTINNKPLWIGYISKKDGKSVKEGPFCIKQLERKDAILMANLSQKIYASLKENEQCFIHKHDRTYYENVFSNKDIKYIGIFHKNELIAMSYIRACKSQSVLNEEIPGCPQHSFHNSQIVASLGGDCVLPKYRGNKMNQLMVEYRIQLAKDLHAISVYSIIDRNNHWNMTPYFNNNFHMFSTSIDPSDGGSIALMQLRQTSHNPKGIREIAVPTNNFDKIDNLLKNNFIGCRFDSKTNCLIFRQQSPSILIKYQKGRTIIQRINNKLEYQHV